MDAEAGGHRVQRVPKNEKRGRVHSSTATVAVLDPNGGSGAARPPSRRDEDFSASWFSGTGAGGQNRNKVMASCRLTHLPSGLTRTAQTRSRENSLRLAREALDAVLDGMEAEALGAAVNSARRAQVGTGERSDRRRLWAFQRDVVEDFETGRSVRCSDALRGKIDRLWRI